MIKWASLQRPIFLYSESDVVYFGGAHTAPSPPGPKKTPENKDYVSNLFRLILVWKVCRHPKNPILFSNGTDKRYRAMNL